MPEPDPDILVDLTTARTAFEAEAIANALESQGIPARAFTLAGSMLQWDIAGTQPMRVQVRRGDLERARAALHDTRQDSVDIDWSEIDTGDPTPVGPGETRPRGVVKSCARCGYDLTRLRDPVRCPECGNYLSASAAQTEVRRPARPVWWVAAGIIAVALAVAVTLPPLVGLVVVVVAAAGAVVMLSRA